MLLRESTLSVQISLGRSCCPAKLFLDASCQPPAQRACILAPETSPHTSTPKNHGAVLISGICVTADLPRQMQPQLIMVVPYLIGAAGHTAAAGVLLARLADAHQQGPQAERELRLPVLSALGHLRINPAVAEKVLQTALEVSSLPCSANLLSIATSLRISHSRMGPTRLRFCLLQSLSSMTLIRGGLLKHMYNKT